MQKAFHHFGLPDDVIQREDFLGKEMDVCSFGVEPQEINARTAVKGLAIEVTLNTATVLE